MDASSSAQSSSNRFLFGRSSFFRESSNWVRQQAQAFRSQSSERSSRFIPIDDGFCGEGIYAEDLPVTPVRSRMELSQSVAASQTSSRVRMRGKTLSVMFRNPSSIKVPRKIRYSSLRSFILGKDAFGQESHPLETVKRLIIASSASEFKEPVRLLLHSSYSKLRYSTLLQASPLLKLHAGAEPSASSFVPDSKPDVSGDSESGPDPTSTIWRRLACAYATGVLTNPFLVARDKIIAAEVLDRALFRSIRRGMWTGAGENGVRMTGSLGAAFILGDFVRALTAPKKGSDPVTWTERNSNNLAAVGAGVANWAVNFTVEPKLTHQTMFGRLTWSSHFFNLRSNPRGAALLLAAYGLRDVLYGVGGYLLNDENEEVFGHKIVDVFGIGMVLGTLTALPQIGIKRILKNGYELTPKVVTKDRKPVFRPVSGFTFWRAACGRSLHITGVLGVYAIVDYVLSKGASVLRDK